MSCPAHKHPCTHAPVEAQAEEHPHEDELSAIRVIVEHAENRRGTRHPQDVADLDNIHRIIRAALATKGEDHE